MLFSIGLTEVCQQKVIMTSYERGYRAANEEILTFIRSQFNGGGTEKSSFISPSRLLLRRF
jgi:hypothetical protein